MSEFSKDYLRGLLLPDPAVTGFWSSETTATQANPRAGTPAAQNDTEAVLTATGHTTDDTQGQQLEILSQRGGYPGADKGGFTWRHAVASPEKHRGWDTPHALTGWENIDFESTVDKNMGLHAVNVTKTDGSDFVVAVDTGFKSAESLVNYRKMTAGVWGSQTNVNTVDKYTNDDGVHLHTWSSVVALPSGRLQVFFLAFDSVEGTMTAQMKYSEDDAATWLSGSRACFEPLDVRLASASLTYRGVPQRLRVAYKDGQHVLFIHMVNSNKTNPDLIIQFASDDMGATFNEVTTAFDGSGVTKAGGYPDVVAAGGKFFVAWVTRDGGKPAVQELGSAFTPLDPTTAPASGGVVATTGAATMTKGSMALTVDEDGAVYFYSIENPNTSPQGLIFATFDGGVTFEELGHFQNNATGGVWWAPENGGVSMSDIRPTEFCAVAHRGQVLICHGYDDNETPSPVGQNSFCVMRLGGYGSVNLPDLVSFKEATKRVTWQSIYTAMTLPGDFGGWVKNTTGGSETLDATEGALKILTTAPPQTLFYKSTFAIGTGATQVDFLDGLIGQVTLKLTIPSTFNLEAQVHKTSGGTESAGFKVNVSTTGVHVYTMANVLLGEVLFSPVGKKVQLLWAVRGGETTGEVAVWYREVSSSSDIDRDFTPVFQGSLVLGTNASTHISWGDTKTTSRLGCFVYEACHAHGRKTAAPIIKMTGRQFAQGQANPAELFPRSYSINPLFFTRNTRVSMTDGPTFENDKWLVDLSHLNPLNDLLAVNAPSPLQGWRSSNNVNGSFIAWQRNPDATDAFTGGLYAIHLEKVNFKKANVTVKSGGSWVSAGSIDLSKQINFTRKGHTVRATGTTAGQKMTWVGFDELKGATFEDASGVTAKISGNTAGFTYQSEGGAPATIHLDPDTYVQGALGTSGVGFVWYQKATHIFELADMDFEGVRLELSPSGETLPQEGFHTIGQAVMGSVAVFGWDYSKDRFLTKEANTELTTQRSGARRSFNAGPSRQRVRFKWSEGVDVTQARDLYTVGGSTTPTTVKFVQSSGTDTANRYDAPLAVFSLVDRLEGAGVPVVYLPKIKTQSSLGSLTNILSDAEGAIYGRVTSPVTIETDVGTENVSEVLRVNTITIEEEV